jgi:hypothetical protein
MAPPPLTGRQSEMGEEGEAGLPELQIDPGDGSTYSRRLVLTHLDSLLDQLETANLRNEAGVPPTVVSELRDLGLPNPEAYSLPDLLAIVFQAQRPLLRSGPLSH